MIPLKVGISHFWTLGVEEQFYLVWPNLMRTARKHLVKVILSVIVGVYFWRLYLVDHGADWIRIYHGFDTRIDTLMIGSLVAIALSTPKLRQLCNKYLGNSWVQIGILLLMLQIGVGLGHPGDGSKAQQLFLWGAKVPLVHVLISSLMISLILAPKSIGTKFFGSAIPAWIGKLSYGIYLWHPLVHAAYCAYFWDYFCNHKGEAEAIQYALIIGIAALSYFLIELPFLKLKSRFA